MEKLELSPLKTIKLALLPVLGKNKKVSKIHAKVYRVFVLFQ